MAPVSRPVMRAQRMGRLWWLPAGGYGNGLDDDAWTPILEISKQDVRAVLDALRAVGIPAYAASAHPASGGLALRAREPAEDYQLWVGSSAHGRAETVLMTVMPTLARRSPGRGGGPAR